MKFDIHSQLGRTQAQRLSRWLELWHQSQDVDGLEDAPTSADQEIPPLPKAAPYDPLPAKAGEIRLLGEGWALPRFWRPTYLAVLGPWTRPDFLAVAPFSFFEVPAFDGEILLPERRPGLLSTVCVWNTFSIPEFALRESWQAGELTGAELSLVRGAFQRIFRGQPLDPSQSELAGPPIIKSDDPRRAYVDSEVHLVAPLHRFASYTIEAGEFLESIGEDNKPEHVPPLPVPPGAVRAAAREACEKMSHAAADSQRIAAGIYPDSLPKLLTQWKDALRPELEPAEAHCEILLPDSPEGPATHSQWRISPIQGGRMPENLRHCILLDRETEEVISVGNVQGNIATLLVHPGESVSHLAEHPECQYLIVTA